MTVCARPRFEEDEMADLWDEEDRYWRQNYASRPYAKGYEYDTLAPGYRYGYESATKYRGRGVERCRTRPGA